MKLNVKDLNFELKAAVGIDVGQFMSVLTDEEKEEIEDMTASEVVEATDFDEPRWDHLFNE